MYHHRDSPVASSHACDNLQRRKRWKRDILGTDGTSLGRDVELELEPEHFALSRYLPGVILPGAELRAGLYTVAGPNTAARGVGSYSVGRASGFSPSTLQKAYTTLKRKKTKCARKSVPYVILMV